MTESTDGAVGAGQIKSMKSRHHDGGWEIFAQNFDIGVRGYGKTRDLAFEEAAYALSATVTDLSSVESRETIDIVCNADSDEILLYEWLNAIINEMATRNMLFSRFSVQTHEHGLTGRAWGEKIDAARHQLAVETRAVTMNELHVARDGEGNWLAQCLVEA